MVLSTVSLKSTDYRSSPVKNLARLSFIFNKDFDNFNLKNTVTSVDDVQIVPPIMTFNNAFEGKKYDLEFRIHNFGTNSAHIRIGNPTSSQFHTKDLHRGTTLSPGLNIKRTVSFTYLRATFVPIAWIPIYINKKLVEYHFKVILSVANITAVPQELDFGVVDFGSSAAVRKFELRNAGSKETRFDIDLGSNDMELIAEPSKGIVRPFDKVAIRVECLGRKLGMSTTEFWVKCATPVKVDVKAEIISVQLQALHRNAQKDFTLIDFPKTYFGTSCKRTCFVRNVSASPTMFCLTADEDHTGEITSLHGLKKYEDFQAPLEGSLRSEESRLFQFGYTPLKDKTKPKADQFTKLSFCSLIITRVSSINLNEINFDAPVESRKSRASESRDSLTSQSEAVVEDSALSASKNELLISSGPEVILQSSSLYIRIFFYGEAETAAINIRPDSLQIEDILVKQEVTRELLLTNCSSSLPIIIKYVKVCYVEVEPKFKILQPDENFEVCVKINSAKLGRTSTKVSFDLYYYDTPIMSEKLIKIGHAQIPLKFNCVSTTTVKKPQFNMGITPTYMKEVGVNVDDIRFNYSGEFPRATLIGTKIWGKNDNEIVAFPNDRPMSLQPWKSTVRCRTICAGIPRVTTNVRDKYQLTKKASTTKHAQYSYYEKYTREQSAKIRKKHPIIKSISDYEVSNSKDLLCKYPITSKCHSLQFSEIKTTKPCIPLTPLELSNIKVTPNKINFGKMAASSYHKHTIKIINSNKFPVNITGRARKPMIEFPGGRYQMIGERSEIEMELIYKSPTALGRSHVIIDVIVNETHTFLVAVTADILPKNARFLLKEIVYEPGERPYKFIDVFNIINVPIAFIWKCHESCFEFFPKSGTIPPYSHLTCMISYNPTFTLVSSIEVSLISENRYHQNLYIIAREDPPKLIFKPQEVIFNDIPINTEIEKVTCLVNLLNQKVPFYILKEELLNGVTIFPTEGILDSCTEQVFTIRVKFSACLKFKIRVQIQVAVSEEIGFDILGNVVYPKITFKPSQIRLRRIVADSFDREEFTITNNSIAKATVNFELGDFPEFFILTECEFNLNLNFITRLELHPSEQKKLYLHFKAIDPGSYCFYLPYIINEIYGPPYYNDAISLNPLTYTQKVMDEYKDVGGITPVTESKVLETLKVISKVCGDTLRISKLNLKFQYFPNPSYNSEIESKLKFWNSSQDTCKFCIRTDEVCYPFFITYYNGNEVEVLPYSIVCVLGPQEWVEFNVEFLPKQPGTYQIKLPIYLKNYLDCHVFNNLFFKGIYPGPTISSSCDEICFNAVPLHFESEFKLELTLEYHSDDCLLSWQFAVPQLVVQISEEKIDLEKTYLKTHDVNLKFSSKIARGFDSTIKFYCTCEAELNIRLVGCAENCVITTGYFSKMYVKWLHELRNKTSLTGVIENEKHCSSDLISNVTATTTTMYDTSAVFEFSQLCDEVTYPGFPKNSVTSEYAIFMRETATILEDWMFEQGFYSKLRYKIPDGIGTSTIFPEEKVENKNASSTQKKKTSDEAPASLVRFIDLLRNLVGPEINNYLKIKECPKENNQRVNYLYNIYANVVKFIKNQGGLFARLYPEFLLEPVDYLTFMLEVAPQREDYEKFRNNKIYHEYGDFYDLGKQSWMDLLLQTYKVFVLVRVRIPKEFTEIDSNETNLSVLSMDSTESSVSDREGNSLQEQTFSNSSPEKEDSQPKIVIKSPDSEMNFINDLAFWQEYSQLQPEHTNIYNMSERILLFWLEYHFSKNKYLMCKRNKFQDVDQTIKTKKVNFFDFDLCDGLVLIGITYSFCPYLIPYLTQIYLDPANEEQMLHNASKLIQSWDMLKLSFSVTPLEIVYPNAVKMIMLVAYLYEVFPNFFPAQDFNFTAGLSEKSSQNLKIDNLSDFRVYYTITCFNNELEMFSTSSTFLQLQPRQKSNLRITFFAKFAANQKVTLLLSGETPKYNYAKSIVVRLIGETLLNHVTTTLKIPSPMYEVLEINSEIQSPYIQAATYAVYYVSETAVSVEEANMISWEEDRLQIMPKRLTVNRDILTCNDQGIGELGLTITTLINCDRDCRIMFKNEYCGDFMICIMSIVETKNKLYETIIVTLPTDFPAFVCSCKENQNPLENKHCPRSVIIEVPCRNAHLWETALESMTKFVDEKEQIFWKKYIGTNVGIMIKDSLFPLQKGHASGRTDKIFQRTLDCNVTIDPEQEGLTFPPTTIIKNSFNPTTHDVLFHFGEETIVQNFNINLKCEATHGYRNYKIIFTTPEEEEETVQSICQLANIF